MVVPLIAVLSRAPACILRCPTRTLPATRSLHASRVRASTSPSTSSPREYFTDLDRRPVILFDGVCNMCNGGVNFVLDWDPAGKVRFCALQSDAGRALLQRCGRSADDISSIVLVEESGYITLPPYSKILWVLWMEFSLGQGGGRWG
jgi:hypothetical protein